VDILHSVNKRLALVSLLLISGTVHADISLQMTSLLERRALASGVDITQLGDLNVADVTQSGQAHYAVLLQQGVLNQILLQQTGYGHQAELMQTGNNNIANIIQSGESNLIRVEQWGNRELSIEQSGVGERISIVQY
jgi:minor curlin subunit